MRPKASFLSRSMILTFLLTLLLGSLVVHAEEVKKAEINFTKYTVNIGDEDNVLRLEMLNQKEGDKKPRWVSYNVNVATVDQDGVVTPLRKGTAVISSGIGFPRKTCVVTVVEPGVKLNKTEATIYRSAKDNTPGNTVTLTAKLNGAAKAATWSSSDTSVATVNDRGVVTSVAGEAGKAGTAVITARANGRTATCKVTVLESAISLDVDSMQLSTRGTGSSIKLVPTVVGAKKTVTWTSSDVTVATVSGGKVTGKAAGKATVTATANGVETTCEVTVVDGQISISEEKVLLYVTEYAPGESEVETRELKTNAASGDAVAWTSSDTDVVSVENTTNGKAKITAVGAGTAVITATCNDKTDTCAVEVKNTSVSIAEKVVHLKTKGAANKYTLNYQVTGRDNKKVTWTSSDPKVVSVSKGKLTGKKAGKATVTMTANGVEDKVQIIVQDYMPTIALNQKEYTLYTEGSGNFVALKATVNGAAKKVEWKSNNPSVAEVNAKGKVTAKGRGSALITATANGVTAKCWISVKVPKIILEKNALIIKPGQKVNLCDYASIEVTGAKQSVTYKSSDAKTVTVDKKGNMTGKKVGNVTVTVKANGIEAECDVAVSDCVTHNWIEVTDAKYNRPAACEESGLSSRECSVCHGKEQEVTEPLGHSFGKWTVSSWSTENAAGLERQVCTRCKEVNTRIIPAKSKGEQAYGYKLVWEDDFKGTELDRRFWNVELHDPGWVNAELQEYVDSTNNIYVKDGNLVIQAIKDGDKYTSGRVNTQNKVDYQYGRFEARAKVPSGKGFLPAFWMMPTDEGYYGQWPKCGEIDIMEVLGDQTKKAHSTLHFGEPHTQKQGTYTLENGDFSEDFHVFACEWDPDEMRFYVDDQLFYTVNDWFSKRPGFGATAYPAPYDQPFYMILNLAVGGSWVGYPDEITQFGDNAQLVVDYVRVYQKDEYDTNVSRTEADVQLRDPDGTGNYIINGDFAKVEDLSKDDGNWQLLLAEGGAATAENADGVLNITQTAAGTKNHSVQIVQANLPIEKGSSYKLSYDAYADADRTVITNVSAPDYGYERYLADTTVALTTTKQTFEHTFEMTSDSDANGRVEFNLGNQGSTAAVHIDNVRLEKNGAVEEEEEIKSFLPDGNFVYNGSFNEGNEPGKFRLAYWVWNISRCKGASVSVTSDAKRELKVVVPETVTALEDVAVYQKPIAISGGKKYVLSFDAYADQAKTIKAAVAGETFESALTTKKEEYRYEFNTAEGLNGSELRFLLGTAGITYIDNVSIREDGLLVNGDFSSGMLGYEMYINDAAKVSDYIVDSLNEDNAFSIDIEDTGAQDWYIQLKQNNVKLEKDKWYKIGFKAKSTLDRQIMYALQRDGSKHKTPDGKEDWMPYSGSQIIDLTKEYQDFSHTFKMTEDTDPETILSITMGAVGGKQISTKHTIKIDNITLEETDPVEIPPAEEGKEMILNGDFSEGDAHWENAVTAPGAAEVSFADGKATYKITNVGMEDWHIQLKHKEALTLEKGAEYAVKFNIKSTASRTVRYAFLNPNKNYDWYGGEDLSLEANDEKKGKVEYTLKVSKETSDTINFVISMGKIAGEDTQASTIEIDDISVKKIGGTGGDTPVDPVEPGAELIKNGKFADGEANWWGSYIAEDAAQATKDFTGNKARYEIQKAGTADWNVQLKQTGLKMKKGTSYKVNVTMGSTIDRGVKFAIMGRDEEAEEGKKDVWFGGEDFELEAGKKHAFSRIVKLEDKEILGDGTLAFQLSMGQLIGVDGYVPHAIEIYSVSITEVADDAAADMETEDAVTIEPPKTGDDTSETGEEMIQNGKFADSEENWWSSYIADDVAQATKTFTGNKARYEIKNAGTEDWNVQLKQTGLEMKKGTSYKVNVTMGSTIGRKVKFAIMGRDEKAEEGKRDVWFGGNDFELKAGKKHAFSRIVKLEDKEILGDGTLAFQLSMGQLTDDADYAPHAIEIYSVSITEVADDAAADEESETEVTIAPPAGSGEKPEDPKYPVEGNLIKNGDFTAEDANWEKVVDTSKATAEVSFTGGKAVYKITNVGGEDYHVQLKQTNLTLEKGANYKVCFTIKSSVARTVKSSVLNYVQGETPDKDQYIGYAGNDKIELTAGKDEEVTYDVNVGDKETSSTIQFVISMGKTGDETIPEHTIEIDNVSVVKVSSTGGTGDDQDDKNMIENGNFSEGEAHWENAVTSPGEADVTFTDGKNGKVTYKINNVGTEDWHIQLKHKEKLTLEKGAEYAVKFNIKSTSARTVKYALLAPSDNWYGGEDLILTAGEAKAVESTVKVDKDTSDQITFLISMGQIYDHWEVDKRKPIDTPTSTIEISDIKLIKVKDGTATEEKSDPDATIVPAANKSSDNVNDDAESAEEAQDDQNIEDQDEDGQNLGDQADISDDPAENEDVDSAETDSGDSETSDTQKASGDADTSDDQSDNGSNNVLETSVDDDNAQTPQN